MHQSALRSTCLVLALLGTASLSAHSQTTLNGFVSGVELCEQDVCGLAIFAAGFAGEIADRPAIGLAIGGINHQPLPTNIGQTVLIIGGQWSIRALRRTLEGGVTGGTLTKLNDTQFYVEMEMEITGGGTGDATFKAILDHGPFPPTIKGVITQSE
jgi:hypothetical protein